MQALHPSDSQPTVLGDYTVSYGQVLGKGATGTVYRGIHTPTLLPVAVKVIELSAIKDDATRSLLDNQKLALKTIAHPNVLKLLQVFERDGRCFIVTELCEGQTLRELILQQGRLSEEDAMVIFRKLLAGCLAVTQSCVIHRDLKPANIIVSVALEPKIIDFGFCEVIQAKKVMRTFNVGSPSYMAPEAYSRTLYSEKSDSWSLGMILFEMLNGRTLDEGHLIKQYFEILKSNPAFITSCIASTNENVREILEKSLKYLPEDRMSISNMKYSADLYHLKRNRESHHSSYGLSQTNGFPTKVSKAPIQTRPPLPQQPSTKLHQNPKTLQNILGQTLNSPNNRGFISFSDFSKPMQFMRSNKASLISLSSSSNKNSSINYSTGVRTNQNYQLLANKTLGTNFEGYQSLSSKEIMQKRPQGPPAFRQVTVRYL